MEHNREEHDEQRADLAEEYGQREPTGFEFVGEWLDRLREKWQR
ncbi:hypothetical protein [Halococcus salifodinae]|nr:hypothetical protein [Halococcus salifodinae]